MNRVHASRHEKLIHDNSKNLFNYSTSAVTNVLECPDCGNRDPANFFSCHKSGDTTCLGKAVPDGNGGEINRGCGCVVQEHMQVAIKS